MRLVVLGGGFGGVATVRHLERILPRRTDVQITLVSRENFFVLTPLLFEACSGSVELRHCAQPIRAALRRARFIEATVQSVDLEGQIVRAVAPDGSAYGLAYDHLVVALGASTNDGLIPGSSNAMTFKTMADASAAVDVPVNADFASGYGTAPEDLAANVTSHAASRLASLDCPSRMPPEIRSRRSTTFRSQLNGFAPRAR